MLTAALPVVAQGLPMGIPIPFPEGRPQPSERSTDPPRVTGYVMWGPDFLYIAARVEDPDLVATNKDPFVPARDDDAVEIDLNLGDPDAVTPSPLTHRLVISAAGGFAAEVGAADGQWHENRAWLAGVRFEVKAQGTLNRGGDVDQGFVVEAALPWRVLGGRPEQGSLLGFNLVVWTRGENDVPVSWSTLVTAPSELADPSRWGRMLLRTSAFPARAENNRILCPPSSALPLVNGVLAAGEWMGASTLEFLKPTPEMPSAAAAPSIATVPPVMAIYCLDLEPTPEGRSALADQPLDGAGPWFSGARIGWHRSQLLDAARAGIDALLVRYPMEPPASGRSALIALVQAMKELNAEGRNFPLLGLVVDHPSGVADVAQVAATVEEFYRIVPAEFRAAALRGEAGKPPRAGVVLLGKPAANAPVDLVAQVGKSFERMFPGWSLYWLADPAWRTHGADGVAGYASMGDAGPVRLDLSDQARVASINPGYRAPGSETIRPRLDTRNYRSDWIKARAANADVVVIDGWNTYADGSEIAPSRQYGFAYLDATRSFAAESAARRRMRVRIVGETLPAVFAPGVTYDIDLLLKNHSIEDISPRDAVTLNYVILGADGAEVASGTAVSPVVLVAGDTRRVTAKVTAKGANASLPEGDYLLRFELMRSRVPMLETKWLMRTEATFTFPIRVGPAPEMGLTVISSTLPARMEAGRAYPVTLRVRNDGATSWSRPEANLICVLRRLDRAFTLSSSPTPLAGITRLGRAAPGQTITVAAQVTAPTEPGDYYLDWGINPRSGESVPLISDGLAQVVAADAGVAFAATELPTTMEAGKRYPARVFLLNQGSRAWEPTDHTVTYHWYGRDGRPVAGVEEIATPLTRRVAPGGDTMVSATVAAPAVPGAYTLVWDLRGPGGQSSLGGASVRSREILYRAVQVTGGGMQAIDLAPLSNVVAATSESERRLGNFDGAGQSFPLEAFPPDRSGGGPWYPAGYYSGSPLATPFVYPTAKEGVSAAVACNGQVIELPAGTTRLHVLGAATAPDVTATFIIEAAGGATREVTVPVSSWMQPPQHGEAIGLRVDLLRTRERDLTDAPRYLHCFTLSLAGPAPAVRIKLPEQPNLRLVALTAETSPPTP
jgi:hypothetical protein